MASTTLEELLVSINASTSELRKELNKGDGSVRNFQKSVDRKLDQVDSRFAKLGTGIARTLRVLASAYAVRQVAGFVSQQLRAADAMLKTTQRIGGTVEALSELEYVADISGVRFETLTMGLQRMTRRIAEAAQGSGEAKDALKELGLDANELAKLPLDQQFERVAEAIFTVGNQSDKTRLAMRLFDSEGVALLQTMTRGADGIRELREEAADLGKTLSTEQAEAAVRANDAITRMDTSVKSLARNLTLELSPALADAAEWWNKFLFPSEVQQVQERLADVTRQIRELQSGAPRFSLIGVDRDERLKKLLEESRQLYSRLQELEDEEFSIDIDEIDVSGAVARAEFKINRLIGGAIKKRKDELKSIFDSFVSDYETAEQEVARKLREFDMVAHMFPENERERIRAAIKETLVDGLEEFDLNAIRSMRRVSEEIEKTTDATRELGFVFESAFENAIIEGEKLSGVLRALLQDILRIILRKTVIGPLTDLVVGALPVPGRQSGGRVEAGKPYQLHRDELYVPDTAGRVFSAAEVARMSMGGGVVIEQHFHVQAGLPPQWTAQLATVTQLAASAARQSVNKELSGRR